MGWVETSGAWVPYDTSTPSLRERGTAAARQGHDKLLEFWIELTDDEFETVGGPGTLRRLKVVADWAHKRRVRGLTQSVPVGAFFHYPE